jgi:hypothetical protein
MGDGLWSAWLFEGRMIEHLLLGGEGALSVMRSFS